MLFVQAFLLLAASSATYAMSWGDQCQLGNTVNMGVCDSTSSCASVGGKATPGFCPGLPNNIQCCYKRGCFNPRACPVKTIPNRCPGGTDNVFCPGYNAFCTNPSLCNEAHQGKGSQATVLTGFCPYGADFKLCRVRV